jgi:stage 0 sporulation regulatory protein
MMMDMTSKSLLDEQINIKRKEMYLTSLHFGLHHSRTIACSQELDRLLNIYETINQTSDLGKHYYKPGNNVVYV